MGSAWWTDAAREQLHELGEEQQEKVTTAIDEMIEAGTSQHEDVKLIKDRRDNWLWRLEVKEEHHDLDHRLFFDTLHGTVKILGLFHRDNAYDNESWEQIEQAR